MGEVYNVFISWSGDRSKKVAAALRDWLPMVVQTAAPWMSEEDIEKGSRGLDDIGKALASMGVGIICLTPENLEKPWILFEAGALSKALGDKTRVCPFLLGDLRPENVKAPLGMFQATRAVKDDTRKLVGTVNKVLGGSLGEEKLDTVFERMWPELDKSLEAVPKAAVAVAPLRSERDMLAEVLELSRGASANIGRSREELNTVLRGVTAIFDRVNEARSPLAAWSGLPPYDVVAQLEAGDRALADAKAARGEGGSGAFLRLARAFADERVKSEGQTAIQMLARLLTEHPELATEVAQWKKADEMKQGDEQAKGGQQKGERRRMHAPSLSRPGGES